MKKRVLILLLFLYFAYLRPAGAHIYYIFIQDVSIKLASRHRSANAPHASHASHGGLYKGLSRWNGHFDRDRRACNISERICHLSTFEMTTISAIDTLKDLNQRLQHSSSLNDVQEILKLVKEISSMAIPLGMLNESGLEKSMTILTKRSDVAKYASSKLKMKWMTFHKEFELNKSIKLAKRQVVVAPKASGNAPAPRKRKMEEEAEIEKPPQKIARHELAPNTKIEKASVVDIGKDDCLLEADVLRRLETICSLLEERNKCRPAFELEAGVRVNCAKTACFGNVKSKIPIERGIVEKFRNLLFKDFEAIDELEKVPYEILEPVLARLDSRRLQMFEKLYPGLASKTDDLWKCLVLRNYPGHNQVVNGTWKELYTTEKRLEKEKMEASKISFVARYRESAANIRKVQLVDARPLSKKALSGMRKR